MGCLQAEAIQEITDPEATRVRTESGRRADKPPRQPDGRPVSLPMPKRNGLVPGPGQRGRQLLYDTVTHNTATSLS